jgi:hypothetical protein
MSSSVSRTPIRILLTGATGYIGGSILDRLLSHPKRSSFEITSFSRNAAKAQKLESQFGVKSVLGSLDDFQQLEEAAATADVVIHTADADHLPAAQAILRGLKRRHASTRETPTFIHTVGTSPVPRAHILTTIISPAPECYSTTPQEFTGITSSTTTPTLIRSDPSPKTRFTETSTSNSSPPTTKVGSLRLT